MKDYIRYQTHPFDRVKAMSSFVIVLHYTESL
jgi:hypothetical protein